MPTNAQIAQVSAPPQRQEPTVPAPVFISTVIPIVLGAMVLVAVFAWFKGVKRLPTSEAVERTAELAYIFWTHGNYPLPSRLAVAEPLKDPTIARQIGQILTAEVIGESSIPGLPEEVSKPHPELAAAASQPERVAKRVQELILEKGVQHAIRRLT